MMTVQVVLLGILCAVSNADQQPGIKVEDGRLILQSSAGKDLGYRSAGGKTIYLTDLEPRMKSFTNEENQAVIQALKLGFGLGKKDDERTDPSKQPLIKVEAGRLILQASNGDSIGYSTVGGYIYFDDLPPRMTRFQVEENKAIVDALYLGFEFAQTVKGTDLIDQLNAFNRVVMNRMTSLKTNLSQVALNTQTAITNKLDPVVKLANANTASIDANSNSIKKLANTFSKVVASLTDKIDKCTAQLGRIPEVSKVTCKGKTDLGKMGYSGYKTLRCTNTSATEFEMIELGQTPSKTLNSFGVVSAATGCKNPIYTKYGGKSPTGPNANQFTKVTIKGCSQRPGGNTYTDLVLKGDFIISFKYYDGASGNGYIFFGFYPETYKKYSHNCLNCNGNSYGQNSQWGTYSVPSGTKQDVSWDGVGSREGRKYVGRYGDVNGYYSFTRTDGVLKMYQKAGHNNPPGDGHPSKKMRLLHTWTSKYTKPVRLSFFLHDNPDWVEVYSPGTSVTLV